MNLVSIRIITDDVSKLMEFYEQITQLKGIRYTEDFAELQMANATLAIGSTRTLQFFGGQEVARAAENHTTIIEWITNDVDRIYQEQSAFLTNFLVQEPKTMPWGNRSLLFRDPDGNLVNFFTPVSTVAIKKFEGKI
ncbi:VOC family protein [Pedobacter zeae]|uniref:Catechol 2,3-dioxygenase-like lactoylglutathione lyase family enzyme n=1 Tax=Pedobacter zeae TaxID=1737356 RepID=A0A7W6KB44_9SPHI|nr:VOC family protein [Pedobacter zeae]MBB4107372.1 catechol 2,3-dioxygenase-like lactoylglutathione lyase family enzyme [Pedobacter zeae]GGH07525.1 glyoxalase [Pedobacter zeae]